MSSPFVITCQNYQATKKNWSQFCSLRCASKRFGAIPSASKHFQALRRNSCHSKWSGLTVRYWKLFQALRKGLSGSTRFCETEALPSVWTLTETFPDDRSSMSQVVGPSLAGCGATPFLTYRANLIRIVYLVTREVLHRLGGSARKRRSCPEDRMARVS